MSRKLKILVMDNSPQMTGAFKSIVMMTWHLANEAEFVFVVPEDSKVISQLDGQVYTIRMMELSRRLTSWLLYPFYLVKNTRLVGRIIRQHNIELVHGNDLYNLIPLCVRLFGTKTPYVVYIRLLSTKFPRVIYNSWMGLHKRYAKKVICVSDKVLLQFKANKKFITIHDPLPGGNGLVGEREENSIILYLANKIKGKGQEHAIKAFAMIHHKFPLLLLKFVGSDMGMEKNVLFGKQLEKLAMELGVSGKIIWQDFTDDVTKEYQSACIALNFSDSESFSMTCLEALFFGCPIVATDSGGPAEIIDNGVSGFLVPVSDINQMARAMEKLLGDPERRKRFSREGMARVRVKFDKANTSRRLLETYYEALERV